MDPILFWNDVALEAKRVSHTNGKNEQTGPTLSSRAMAIVHLAVYDAYAGVINKPSNLPLYLGGTPVPSGASPGPAVAAAAHETLSKLFPSQKPYFDLVLAGAGDTSNPGHAFGWRSHRKFLPIGRVTLALTQPATCLLRSAADTAQTPTIPARAAMLRSMERSQKALQLRRGTRSRRHHSTIKSMKVH